MAGQANLNFKIVDSSGVAIASAPVLLLNQIYSNPFTAVSTSLVSSGTTNVAGSVLFTSISDGKYDVQINGSSGNAYIRGYVVKGEYQIPIGESSFAFENRTYIRSNENTANILGQNKMTQTGTAIGILSSGVSFPIPLPVSGSEIFSTTTSIGKQSGNSYYYANGSIPFTQRARFSVSL